MPEDKVETKPKISWPSIFSTIAAGILLAGLNYSFSSLATYFLTERIDVFFVDRPRTEGGRFQKLAVIDNFSSNKIDDLQFSIATENGTVSSQINMERIDQSVVGPRTFLVKVFGLLPNREACFVLESDVAIPDDNVRLVKGPSGVAFKSKDKLRESWLDWSQIISAFIQFLIYVIVMTYLDKRVAQFSALSDELNAKLSKTQAEMEQNRTLTAELRQDELRNKLVHVRRILNLGRENRLWREVALGILQQDSRGHGAAIGCSPSY
jgi:hypothetical protein